MDALWCEVCNRRMWGHTPKPGYTYYACRTRDRVAPAGHPAFICLDEDHLLRLLTEFFNTRIFGSDRIQLATASVNLAAQQAADDHDQKIKATRYGLADIEARQRRLLKILEENDEEGGNLYRQAKERQSELDIERRRKTAELHDLEQNKPLTAAGTVDLLNDMPSRRSTSPMHPPTGSVRSSTRSRSNSATTSARTPSRSARPSAPMARRS